MMEISRYNNIIVIDVNSKLRKTSLYRKMASMKLSDEEKTKILCFVHENFKCEIINKAYFYIGVALKKSRLAYMKVNRDTAATPSSIGRKSSAFGFEPLDNTRKELKATEIAKIKTIERRELFGDVFDEKKSSGIYSSSDEGEKDSRGLLICPEEHIFTKSDIVD